MKYLKPIKNRFTIEVNNVSLGSYVNFQGLWLFIFNIFFKKTLYKKV